MFSMPFHNGTLRLHGGATEFPQVLGWDLAGEVVGPSPGVDGFELGDPVMGFVVQPWMRTGSFAEN